MRLGIIQIQQTDAYAKWFAGLRNRVARARINIRIRRLLLGNAGNAKPVGECVSELRVDHGPGYRVTAKAHSPMVLLVECSVGTTIGPTETTGRSMLGALDCCTARELAPTQYIVQHRPARLADLRAPP